MWLPLESFVKLRGGGRVMLEFARQHLNYIVGGVIVAFYSVRRFGTPETNQSSTTRPRYRRSCLSYLLAAELLFFVLSQLVSSAGVLQLLAPAAPLTDKVPKEVLNLSAPLLAALLMTTFISSVPLLSDVDQWLVGKFRELADIPDELKRRAAGLELAKLPVATGIRSFRSFVECTAEIPDELLDEVAGTGETQAAKNLIRTLILYRWLYTASTRHGYARFLWRQEAEWKDIQERFSVFCAQSLSMFASARALAAAGRPESGSRRELAALRQSYAAHCKTMFNVMARFLARAVLACEPNEKAISRALRDVGFPDSVAERPRFPADQVVLVSIGLLFILVMGPAMLPHLGLPTFPPMQGVPAASIPALTWTTHIAAIAVAVWCKYGFAPVANGMDDRRMVGVYCEIFVLAWLAAETGAVAVFALTHDWNPAALLGYPYMYFSLLAAIVATAVVVACDNRWGLQRADWGRWLDAGLCGGIVAAAVLPVDWTITYLVGDWAAAPMPDGWLVAVPIGFGFAAGFIPGACIPTWYRAALAGRTAPPRRALARGPFSEAQAGLRQVVAAVPDPMPPGAGEPAMGYGLDGAIATVPDHQPLGEDGIWRVTLKGEPFGRLVRLDEQRRRRTWQLLQIDDLTDAQLDAYEAAMSGKRADAAPPTATDGDSGLSPPVEERFPTK